MRRTRNGYARTNLIDARAEKHSRVADEVAKIVCGGGTVIFPTDTVYGIGCDPFDRGAIARIYGAKERPANKPLSLHLSSVREFLEYFPHASPDIVAAARRLLPGPLTMILPKPAFIEQDVTAGFLTLGFRVPDDPFCSLLLERCGPLAATSANISGQSAYRGEGPVDGLPAADLVVLNGPTKYRQDSTVMDMTSNAPVIVREGVLSAERLSELMGRIVNEARGMKNA